MKIIYLIKKYINSYRLNKHCKKNGIKRMRSQFDPCEDIIDKKIKKELKIEKRLD